MTKHPKHMGHWAHLHHVQCLDDSVSLLDLKKEMKDLYGLQEFHDNYVNPKNARNYNVLCVNFDKLFDNFNEFNSLLGLPLDNEFIPKNKRSISDFNKLVNEYSFLVEIYKEFNKSINSLPPIFIK